MRATWRPLPAWPYPPRHQQPARFKTSWSGSLDLLDREIGMLGADDVLIGVVAGDDQFTLAGTPKPGFKTRHPGAEVSFTEAGGKRLVFHTDAYPTLHANLHAIGLGLEALRAVDRYGITSTAEQYAGFAQLTSGGPDPARGKALVDRAGGLAEALKKHHPDQGGSNRDIADVLAYREAIAR